MTSPDRASESRAAVAADGPPAARGSGARTSSRCSRPRPSSSRRSGSRHGGPDQLGEGPAGILTAIGQVTALYGTYLALIQLVLMSRSPWLDETFGMDGLAVAHRWLGFTTVWLLLGHGIATHDRVRARRRGRRRPGVPDAHHDLPVRAHGDGQRRAVRPRGGHVDPGRPPEAGVRDVVRPPPLRVPRDRARLPAPALRRRGLHARPAWPRSTGSCSTSRPSSARSSPSASGSRSARRSGTGSGWPTWSAKAPAWSASTSPGGDLDRLAGPGRPVLPLALPDAATAGGARTRSRSRPRRTASGCGSRSRTSATARATSQRLPIGTRVMVEGPYGILTDVNGPSRASSSSPAASASRRCAPCSRPCRPRPATSPCSIARAGPQDVIFRDELDDPRATARDRRPLPVGQRGSPAVPRDPLDARGIVTLVPDVLERDVYVCAPASMMRSAEAALRRSACRAGRSMPNGSRTRRGDRHDGP